MAASDRCRRPGADAPQPWEKAYRVALRRHLAENDEATLLAGYEAGREGLREGRNPLDLVICHRAALATLPGRHPPREPQARALSFLTEALAPYALGPGGGRAADAGVRLVCEREEREARRLAAALHGGAAQLLAAVHMQLAQLAEDLPAASAPLAASRRLLDEIAEQLGEMERELHCGLLNDLGLAPALAALTDGFARRTGMRVSLRARNLRRLPAALESTLYRAVQEALRNVERHARARAVRVEVRDLGDGVLGRVQDDGVGSAAALAGHDGLGLAGLGERVRALGGILHWKSEPGRGAALQVLLPLAMAKADHAHSGLVG